MVATIEEFGNRWLCRVNIYNEQVDATASTEEEAKRITEKLVLDGLNAKHGRRIGKLIEGVSQ